MAKRQESNAGLKSQLTTIFAAPTNCVPVPSNSARPGYALAADASDGQWAIASASRGCDPGEGQQTFSPGVCPRSYTPWTAGFDQSETTSVACCLTGSLSVTGSSASCVLSITDSNNPIMLATQGSTYTTLTSGTLIKGAIWVEWASSDLASFEPASAPLLMQNGVPFTAGTFSIDTSIRSAATDAMTTTTGASSTAPATNSASSTPTGQSDGGLSTGAEAGIGVGVGVSGLAILAGIAYFFYRRGKKSHDKEPRTPIVETGRGGTAEADSVYRDDPHAADPQEPKPPVFCDNENWQSASELAVNDYTNPVELDAAGRLHELDETRPR